MPEFMRMDNNEGCESSHCARLSCGTEDIKGVWLFVSGDLIESNGEKRGSGKRDTMGQKGYALPVGIARVLWRP